MMIIMIITMITMMITKTMTVEQSISCTNRANFSAMLKSTWKTNIVINTNVMLFTENKNLARKTIPTS